MQGIPAGDARHFMARLWHALSDSSESMIYVDRMKSDSWSRRWRAHNRAAAGL